MATENRLEKLQNELKTRQICRFCLSSDKLVSIYSQDARIQSSVGAPLSVQVLSVTSIEVFSNDGMPSWICTACRIQFEHSYQFKQMCKHAEFLLRQYPLTGAWPDALPKPKFSQERIPKTTITSSQEKSISSDLQPNHPKPSASDSMKILNSKPVASPQSPVLECIKKEKMDDHETILMNKVDNNEELSKDDVTRLIAAVDSGDNEEFITDELVASLQPTRKPIVLNKSSIPMLKKEAEIVLEPHTSEPQVKRDPDGNDVIEILDEPEVDALKSAKIVETDAFPCPHCERSFPLRQLRDMHMVSLQCTGFEKSFSTNNLHRQNILHTGERLFICTICQESFTRAIFLHRHEKVHTDIPKYICVYCEKAFFCKDELDKHTQNHKKNRPHQCKVCNKSFANKQSLERHVILHSRDQPYPCQYCDQSFSTPSKLSRHLTAHVGNRPYPCKFCAKSYLLSHHLSRHMRSHKLKEGVFQCKNCDKVYKTRDELIYHSAMHATATLVCSLCKEVFAEVSHAKAHIREHIDCDTYACEFCDLIFMSSERLQGHTDKEHSDEMEAYHKYDKTHAQNNSDEEADVVNRHVKDHEGIIEVERIVSNKPKILNQTIIQAGQQVNTNDYTSQSMFDIDNEVMVINEADSADDEQPSPKKFKFSKLTPNVKEAKEIIEETRRSFAPKPTFVEASLPKAQLKVGRTEKLRVPEKVAKSKQPAISSILKDLPRAISIRRNTIAAAAQTTSITTTEKQPSSNTTTVSQKQTAKKKKSQPQSPPQPTVPKQKKQKERVLRGRRSYEPHTSSGGYANKKSPITVKSSPATKPDDPVLPFAEIMIDNKKVKVQKVTLTKTEAKAMAKDGLIRVVKKIT